MSNGFSWLQLANLFGQPNGAHGQLHVYGFASGQTLPRIEHYGLPNAYHWASHVAGRLLVSLGAEWQVFRSDWDRWQFVVAHFYNLGMKDHCRDAARRAVIVHHRLVRTQFCWHPITVEVYYQAPAEVVNILLRQIDVTAPPDSFSVPSPCDVSRTACLAIAAHELTRRTPDTGHETGHGKKTRPQFPESKAVMGLINKLRRDLAPGVRYIDVALDFADGNKAKAENLLRQANRYAHLWKPGHAQN